MSAQIKNPASGRTRGLGVLQGLEAGIGTNHGEIIAMITSDYNALVYKEVHKLWQEAVLRYHDDPYVPAPTLAVAKVCKGVMDDFKDFFPESEFPIFLDKIIGKWGRVCFWLERNTILYNFGDFPTLPWISKNQSWLLQWYGLNREKQQPSPVVATFDAPSQIQ